MMGCANNNPKPSAKPQVNWISGRGYVVVDGNGREVSGPYSDKNKALMAAEAMRREADAKAKRGPRPCLCCGTEFPSEGVHNRLCSRCRHREAGDDPVRPYISRGRRAA